MRLRPYEPGDAAAWDSCVARSLNGTFLHSRRFLGYHGERFQDASLVIERTAGNIDAVFPAALDPTDTDSVCSHPGLTFGGLLHGPRLSGEAVLDALGAIARHYARLGRTRLHYKAVPGFYHRAPAAEDSYALFRLGAHRERCDLSSTIDLAARLPVSHGREQALRSARQANLDLASGAQWLPGFWELLSDNLRRRHDTAPVHDLDEIIDLQQRFPHEIECIVARRGDALLAGAVLFWHATTLHCQYLASTQEGRDLCALDLVIEHAIALATTRGRRWFDFGTSTEARGTRLNAGLYDYKRSFGAGSTVHDFYALDLEPFR
jgi:hypothetical protein